MVSHRRHGAKVISFADRRPRTKRKTHKSANGLESIRLWSGVFITIIAGLAAYPALIGDTGLSPHTSGDTTGASLPLCGSGKRTSCIVDGDTIWLRGEKIRLAGIDAPEVSGPACTREARLGRKATLRLRQVLSSGSWTISRQGYDRYGRTLAKIKTENGSVGNQLVNKGLAKVWNGKKAQWC